MNQRILDELENLRLATNRLTLAVGDLQSLVAETTARNAEYRRRLATPRRMGPLPTARTVPNVTDLPMSEVARQLGGSK